MSDYRDPISVNMVVNGVLVNMEFDTGAAVSIISLKTWQTGFLKTTLQPSTVRLKCIQLNSQHRHSIGNKRRCVL